MQSENSFDKLSKRIAVAVSRRMLLRSISLAVAGTLLPWRTALADVKKKTSADLETNFFAAPVILELRLADQLQLRCIAAVAIKDSGAIATGAAYATRDGECPTDVASYFENSDLPPERQQIATFDKTRMFDVRVVEGRSRLINTYPMAYSYSILNPVTGKQEFEAYCAAFTYLDPRVHQGQPDRKLIIYKRKPVPKQLTSFDDEVTCGDINYAYENEIKTRKPIALSYFTVDAVPHQASAKRVNATGTSTRNHSGHKSK